MLLIMIALTVAMTVIVGYLLWETDKELDKFLRR